MLLWMRCMVMISPLAEISESPTAAWLIDPVERYLRVVRDTRITDDEHLCKFIMTGKNCPNLIWPGHRFQGSICLTGCIDETCISNFDERLEEQSCAIKSTKLTNEVKHVGSISVETKSQRSRVTSCLNKSGVKIIDGINNGKWRNRLWCPTSK